MGSSSRDATATPDVAPLAAKPWFWNEQNHEAGQSGGEEPVPTLLEEFDYFNSREKSPTSLVNHTGLSPGPLLMPPHGVRPGKGDVVLFDPASEVLPESVQDDVSRWAINSTDPNHLQSAAHPLQPRKRSSPVPEDFSDINSIRSSSEDSSDTDSETSNIPHFLARIRADFYPPKWEGSSAVIQQYRQTLIHATGWYNLRDCPATEIETSLRKVATLGHGSLGVVDAVQTGNMLHFVRKRVFIPHRRREQLIEIVQSESRAIERLAHTHIVHMMGTYEHHPESRSDVPSFSLLMFPIGERDLATFLHDCINDTTLKKDWLHQWFSCLTSALAYMHDHGVRHQDIKPSNIIHNGSHVYFTDFSSSALFNPESTTSTDDPARTSAMYCAPEMLKQSSENHEYQRHGTQSDVFSLGCVF
ncbi:kinase-like domain-containing protein [Massariosphaeria phaeospora]|uniref:Kinase-like domain-containing protein n=1 Tax=Massariosphaeria phaeospora TaxID=100035 RepID=A0A7C8I4J7_9PLEO|nr:kinase-like domain-containing protein [Massariosphaeria phaeospora]